MQAFRITGTFHMGRDWTTFSMEVAANDEAAAREKAVSTIGSRHRANRREIKIEKTEAIQADQITDAVVRRIVETGASQ